MGIEQEQSSGKLNTFLGRRKKSKELFDKYSRFKGAIDWHIWKMAFDFGVTEQKKQIDKAISAAIRYGIELSQTGKVKEGFPDHIVDQIVKFAVDKLKDNLENGK